MIIGAPHLNEREIEILRARRKQIPYKVIAETFDLSQTRARMIYLDAVNKLIDAAITDAAYVTHIEYGVSPMTPDDPKRPYLEEQTPA